MISRKTKLRIYAILFPILIYLSYYLYISTVIPKLPEPSFAKKEVKLFSNVTKIENKPKLENISYSKIYKELSSLEQGPRPKAKYYIGLNCSRAYRLYYQMLLAMLGYALGVEKYNITEFQFFCYFGKANLPTIDPYKLNKTPILIKLVLRPKFYKLENGTKVYKCDINISKSNKTINITITSDANLTAYKSCIARFTIFFVEKFLPSVSSNI